MVRRIPLSRRPAPTPPPAVEDPGQDTLWRRLRRRLHELYFGDTIGSVRFRLAWLVVDLAIIAFFIAAPVIRELRSFYVIDYLVAALLGLDLTARAAAHGSLREWLSKWNTWVDLFVLATLLAPFWLFNFGFLRVLRLWTLVNSDVLWRTVGRRWDDTRVEDVTRAAVTLITFVFVMTGFVYAGFAGRHEGLVGYMDALYFTVASLTTTGYGDITLPGVWGRLISIVAMVVGITLFVRLAQAVFQPTKVLHHCPGCGLPRHDPDAVHCKRCGAMLPLDEPLS